MLVECVFEKADLSILLMDLFLFLQGDRGFDGLPGLPGNKGHRVRKEHQIA